MHRIIYLLALLSLPRLAFGVEVSLRAQVAPRGSVVRLGDVAELTAAAGEDVTQLAATPLMPAPAAGTVQYLRATELLDMLAANGVDVRNMQFIGAEKAAIGEAAAIVEGEQLNAEAELPEDRGAVAEEITSAVAKYLERETGHSLWKVELDADAKQLQAICALGKRLTLRGGKAPWTGVQRMELSACEPAPA